MGVVKRIRLSSVSYDHPAAGNVPRGMDFDPIVQVVREVAKDGSDFICLPEIAATPQQPLRVAIESAPCIEEFVEQVGQLAREVDAALVIPTLERHEGKIYNAVPIVDRQGTLVMTYRKNFPTPHEMGDGVSPGWEVPVEVCDGVRVGAAVCFDANFPEVLQGLAKGGARVVFWPSMFWGGRLLSDWAMRGGFYLVAAHGAESAIVDMNGRFIEKRGLQTFQVQQGHLPAWVTVEVNVDRELYHLDLNQDKFEQITKKYGPDIGIEVMQPECVFLMESRIKDKSVEEIASEFEMKTAREYFALTQQMREERKGNAFP